MSDSEETWKDDGIFLIALPDATLKLVRRLSKETGKAFPDVISESIMRFWEAHEKDRAKPEVKLEVKPENKKTKVRFR